MPRGRSGSSTPPRPAHHDRRSNADEGRSKSHISSIVRPPASPTGRPGRIGAVVGRLQRMQRRRLDVGARRPTAPTVAGISAATRCRRAARRRTGPRKRSSRPVEWCCTVAPRVEDVLDTTSHLCSPRFARGARHEEVVVVGVNMPDGGHDGESDPRAYPGRLPSRSKRLPTARGTPPARRPNRTPDIEVTSPARVGRFPVGAAGGPAGVGPAERSWAVTTGRSPTAHVWMASAQLRCGRQDQRLIHGTVSLRCLRCSATVGLTMRHGLQIARGRQCDRFRRLRRETVRLGGIQTMA